jgi:hypothetical protein
MRALRRSPLLCTAVLSLVVLLARTARAATRPIAPSAPPSPLKLAATQPDPEKKPALGPKRVVRPACLADVHNLFGNAFCVTNAHAASLLSLHSAVQIARACRTASLAPQRRPFDLRI